MVASKSGWIKQVHVYPGKTVAAGQVVAHMNTQDLEAQLRETGIVLLKARVAAEEARNQLNLYLRARSEAPQPPPEPSSEISMNNDLGQYANSLSSHDGINRQVLNNDHTAATVQEQRQQDIINAKREKTEWRAKATAIRSQLLETQSAVIAAQTTIKQLQTDIADSTLTAPMTGLVLRQYFKDGDWVAQGDKVLQIMDLGDVYMKFSLPAYHASALAIGTEVRLVLDFPSTAILPAQISYIAPNASSLFEIWNEMIDQQQQVVIKAKIAQEHLQSYDCEVTDGVTGRAYVQLDKNVEWPKGLNVRHQDCIRSDNQHNIKITSKIINVGLN